MKEILTRLGFHSSKVEPGEANIGEQLQFEGQDRLRSELRKVGLQLLEKNNSKVTRNIKNMIEDMVQHTEESPNVNFSLYLARQPHHD